MSADEAERLLASRAATRGILAAIQQPHQRQILHEMTHQHRQRGEPQVIDPQVGKPEAQARQQESQLGRADS